MRQLIENSHFKVGIQVEVVTGGWSVIAAEILEDLESALEQMRLIAEDLGAPVEKEAVT